MRHDATTSLQACFWYWVAQDEDGGSKGWRSFACSERGCTPGETYVASLYWSTATFFSVGFGDIHARTLVRFHGLR
jgi:hypothetical protein